MNDTDLQAFELHAKLNSYKRKVDLAKELIYRALEQMPNPYIAFSGGKDSTVVLDLVRSINADVVAQYGHEQWVLPETEQFIKSKQNLVMTALPDRHSEWFTVWDNPDDVPPGVIYVDRNLYTEFDYAKKLLGFDGCFLGLRSEENSYRRLHLGLRGPLFYCKKHGMIECNPIHNWSVMDVWAYITNQKIDYNGVYDVLSRLQIELKYQRVGPVSQWRALKCGQIAILKKGWPDFYNKFELAYPQASLHV